MLAALKTRIAQLSFRAQLVTLAAGAGLLAVIFLGLTTAGLVSWVAQQSMRHQQELMRPLLAAALTGPMIERNYAAVGEIAREIVGSESVTMVTVRSAAGDIVVQVSSEGRTTGLFTADMALDLVEGGLGFGRIELRLTADLLATLTNQLLLALFAVLALSSLLAVFLFHHWARHLGRRIEDLAASASGLAAGHYATRSLDAGTDEVGRLAQTFNLMADKVARAIDDLAVSESRWAAILQSIGEALIATDTQLRVTYLNPIAESLTGWQQAEACGRPIAEVLKLENARTGQAVDIPLVQVRDFGGIVSLASHTVMIARDGSRRHISDCAAPIRDAAGQLVGAVMVFQDVTEAYGLRASLEESRMRLSLALQGADLGLWDRNLVTGELIFDERFAAILGYRLDEIEQTPETWKSRVHPDDLPASDRLKQTHLQGLTSRYESEYRMRHKSGEWSWILSRGRVTERDAAGKPLRVTGTILDITERKHAEAEIEHLAFFDPLTGLPNRRLLQDRLGLALASARRTGEFGTLLFIDLDNFKRLNDSRGHAVGDRLLKEVARRLGTQLREADTLARLGGDEFVVLLANLGHHAANAANLARDVAEKLRTALSPGFTIEGSEYHASASIGIALFPEHAESADDLLRHADTAMYAAKETGRNRVRFFEPDMQAAAEARMALEGQLRLALERNELRLYLQSQTDGAGRVVGFEALLRWQHPERGLVAPVSFIPLAEETGLIVPIGEWVLETALIILKQLDDAGHNFRVAVNVSPLQFREPDFVLRVRKLLQQTGAYAPRLTLEITEGMLVHDIEAAIARMNELRHLGVSFSIDDFGTGYSSLSYLKRLPLRELKIDRAFVNGLPRDPDDVALVGTILDIADSFRLDVVAEGVETQVQLDFLKASGCEVFQGYLFSRPQPAEELLAQLV
jgi:diguanylate cyclase (GGDEF)-like protein/PAS domain S-box-containing protein